MTCIPKKSLTILKNCITWLTHKNYKHALLMINIFNRTFIISIINYYIFPVHTLIARLMGPTWGPHGTARTQVGPMLATRTLLSVYTFGIKRLLHPGMRYLFGENSCKNQVCLTRFTTINIQWHIGMLMQPISPISINVITNLPKYILNTIVHAIHRITINPANHPAFRPHRQIEYE